MDMSKYENKEVLIETNTNQIFKGVVGDYIDEFDSPTGKEMLVLDIPDDNPIGLSSDEIVSISVINKQQIA